MSIDFLPETYTRATVTNVAVPVTDVADLTDPWNRRIVIPARVEIHFRRDEGTPQGGREYAFVSVVGPRRLKSGEAGQPITTCGWAGLRNDGPRGYVARPEWLTRLLAENMPTGWNPLLLELAAVTA